MLKRVTYAFALIVLIALPARAQDNKWSWHKTVPAGKTIEIKGIIGSITAAPAAGNEVEVVATKRGRRYGASSVKIQVEEYTQGVRICAIYDDADGCDGKSSSHDNDTKVDFEVRVPKGVLFTGRTVIGDVIAEGMTADIDASSVTGDVRVSTTGLAEANTVSGSIHVRMGRTDWDRLDFRTVSGNITLELPRDLNTNVSFTTVSGDVSTDWEIQSRGNISSRRLKGTIGNGGRELSLSTVSGDVELRRIN